MEAVCDGCKPAPSKNRCCNCQGSLKKDGLRLADCTDLHRVRQHILGLVLTYSTYCSKTDLVPPGAVGLFFYFQDGQFDSRLLLSTRGDVLKYYTPCKAPCV